jgi:DNA-binding HxlR family transcriptional regulator
MRSYGQFCALARALDVIGDRWNLLIVREIMVRGRARYTDIRNGLPGIASNLLADRLRELEASRILEREDAPPPVSTTLYSLTERGQALRPVLRELGRWGAPLLATADRTDQVRGYWIGLPAELYLTDAAPNQPPVTLEIRTGDEPVTLSIGGGVVRSSLGAGEHPDAVIAGPARHVACVLLANASLADARKRGVTFTGSRKVLSRLSSRL